MIGGCRPTVRGGVGCRGCLRERRSPHEEHEDEEKIAQSGGPCRECLDRAVVHPTGQRRLRALGRRAVAPLALLASAADEQARAELTNALGRPAESGQQDALELIDILRGGVSTTAALGVWTRKGIPLDERWAAGLPEGVVGALTDQAALDRLASAQTNGLIEEFPLEVTVGIVLILASALAALVKWRTPFDASPRGKRVSWDDPGEPDQQWLRRKTYDLSEAAVLDGAVSRIVVEGDGDVDVHLLLGEQQPSAVLAAGLRELAGEAEVR